MQEKSSSDFFTLSPFPDLYDNHDKNIRLNYFHRLQAFNIAALFKTCAFLCTNLSFISTCVTLGFVLANQRECLDVEQNLALNVQVEIHKLQVFCILVELHGNICEGCLKSKQINWIKIFSHQCKLEKELSSNLSYTSIRFLRYLFPKCEA